MLTSAIRRSAGCLVAGAPASAHKTPRFDGAPAARERGTVARGFSFAIPEAAPGGKSADLDREKTARPRRGEYPQRMPLPHAARRGFPESAPTCSDNLVRPKNVRAPGGHPGLAGDHTGAYRR